MKVLMDFVEADDPAFNEDHTLRGLTRRIPQVKRQVIILLDLSPYLMSKC